jgi:hypothetical protein
MNASMLAVASHIVELVLYFYPQFPTASPSLTPSALPYNDANDDDFDADSATAKQICE